MPANAGLGALSQSPPFCPHHIPARGGGCHPPTEAVAGAWPWPVLWSQLLCQRADGSLRTQNPGLQPRAAPPHPPAVCRPGRRNHRQLPLWWEVGSGQPCVCCSRESCSLPSTVPNLLLHQGLSKCCLFQEVVPALCSWDGPSSPAVESFSSQGRRAVGSLCPYQASTWLDHEPPSPQGSQKTRALLPRARGVARLQDAPLLPPSASAPAGTPAADAGSQ